MPKLNAKTPTLNRRQWLMIVLLAVALGGALYWPEKDAVESDAAQQAADTASAPKPAQTTARQPKVEHTAKKWPEIDLDTVLRHDPFHSQILLTNETKIVEQDDSAARQEQVRTELAFLRQKGVTMIFQNSDGVVATVGERTLKIGDVIDGYRVAAIGNDGVLLEPMNAE